MPNFLRLLNFSGSPAVLLKGKSVSLDNAPSGKWKQTWVDNQASYLDFSAGFKNSKMILQRKATQKRTVIMQRMTFGIK